MTSSPHHLVAVWNPSYQRNAIEEHLTVLLEWSARWRAKRASAEDVYVWWGRVRSSNRRNELPHLGDIQSIDDVLGGDVTPETHLYLTDYQSLYVANLGEIHFGELPEDEREHVPDYYATDHLACDFWLKLWDIRRLELNDLPATVQALKQLRNVHYHDLPVSLYGGMVELPLVVTRPDGARFFDPADLRAATELTLWAEFDASVGGGVAAIERTLRDDLLGEAAWSALAPAVRTFLATGERVFREHRTDPAFDFAPVLTSFAKALEVQLDATLRTLWPRIPRDARLMNVNGRGEDLAEMRGLGLNDLVHALAGDQQRAAALAQVAVNGGWLTQELPAALDGFRQVRNAGTHQARIDRRTAALWRNQILGVGCAGHIVKLARVRPR